MGKRQTSGSGGVRQHPAAPLPEAPAKPAEAALGAASRAALATVQIELVGLTALHAALLSPDMAAAFERAVAAIAGLKGRVIVTGMGKSGIIARKIASTLASTGTPSLFLHPAEASHGDLGMVTSDDLVLALSWSGETVELGDIITYCHRFDVPLIVMTARPESAAGRAATICLVAPAAQEACPNRLAPTTSTTIQLVLGDALAVALVEARGFSAQDFRIFHPGGKLGAQLLTVREVMAEGEDVPMVSTDATMMDATIEMSRKRYGSTAVVDESGHLVGAFTDGDLRRSIASGALQDPIVRHMTHNPKAIGGDALASEALRIMNDSKVTLLFVCDSERLCGMVHLHDILRAGVV
ncbi:MAG: KpsF/GutQ family sugar-phosphate isomerase [Sphingomonas fennica]